MLRSLSKSRQLVRCCRALPIWPQGVRCVSVAVTRHSSQQKPLLQNPSANRCIGVPQGKRFFWRMLNAVFNRPDRSRIQEVGVDRACAEWLLRCGAHCRWAGNDRWQTDYNTLPKGNVRPKLAEFNAHEAAVMDIGFEHLKGLTELRKCRFYHCPYLEDGAIQQLGYVKDSLESLEIGSCGDISDDGLRSLAQLSYLKELTLYDLPNVRNKKECLDSLQKALPQCAISFKDITGQEKT